ncbi:uncharacterized protein LOC131951046 [Physella acuta]|uniref:uncharacterized protein LOC131951046 n=1 Tax=Physella acuta TaxID=109671 RepID=UPI0027DD4295|nr:uncharacterized protein LOC131951046 [Physella acuta]
MESLRNLSTLLFKHSKARHLIIFTLISVTVATFCLSCSLFYRKHSFQPVYNLKLILSKYADSYTYSEAMDFNQSVLVFANAHLRPSPRFPGTENSTDPTFSSTQHSILCVNQSSKGLPLHSKCVNITQEGIKIVFSGLYYIYSNINFTPNTTRSSSDFTYQTWFQYVHRHSAHSPVLSGVLLRTVHTTCANCTHSQETANTGGIFNLQTGDLIQVSVSGQGLVDFGQGQTSLGLFLLRFQVGR